MVVCAHLEEEKQKFMEKKINSSLCWVKGCIYKRRNGKPLCEAHRKRLRRRGSLLCWGTTKIFTGLRRHGGLLDSIRNEDRRDPYGVDNSTKTEFVAELIRRVDGGE